MGAEEHRGVVAAGHDLTAAAAADALRRGGNAFDAAVAAVAMASVCEPILCSPGGGGFAMCRFADGSTRLFDFFPQTPLTNRQSGDDGVRRVLADFGTAEQPFHIGPATAATPGFAHGLRELHAHAVLPLSELVTFAVDAARRGFEVTAFQHFLSTVVAPIVTATPAAASVFAPGGELLRAGEIFRNPGLAEALELLASEPLPGGRVGTAIVDHHLSRGHIGEADLADYAVVERVPLTIRVGDAVVHLNPLPAASGTLIEHSLAQLESTRPVDVAEAFATTSAAREAATGDLATLGSTPLRQRGTTHISVLDAEGGACAVTTSNGSGNGEIIDGFGFMMNNILGEEDVNPAGAAGWPTRARLSSMMAPTLIDLRGGGLVALGSGGSSRIRTAISQVVLRLCLGGEHIADAVHAPRLHVEGRHLDFEDFFDAADTAELRAAFADHRAWPERNLFYGGVHAAGVDGDGAFVGVGDSRRGGSIVIVDG